MTNTNIKEICSEIVRQLREANVLRQPALSPYQKTEQLLYNYRNFQQVIDDKRTHIEFLKSHGIPHRSADVVQFSPNKTMTNQSDQDKLDDQIESIERSISITERGIDMVNRALLVIESDAYYDIIPMRYFEQLSREEIAEHYAVDVSTISRNKSRLVNRLALYLFSDDVLRELLS